MTHLLDTNSCVEQLRGRASAAFTARLAGMRSGDVVLCSVVVAELLYGAARSANPLNNRAQVHQFCAPFVSLSFDDQAAEEYGEIRAHLEQTGRPIGPNDLLIAAIARSWTDARIAQHGRVRTSAQAYGGRLAASVGDADETGPASRKSRRLLLTPAC